MYSKLKPHILYLKFLQLIAILPFTLDLQNIPLIKPSKLQHIYSVMFSIISMTIICYCYFCWFYYFWKFLNHDFVRLIGMCFLMAVHIIEIINIVYHKIYFANDFYQIFNRIIQIGLENDEKNVYYIFHMSILLTLVEHIICPLILCLIIFVKSTTTPFILNLNFFTVIFNEIWERMSLIPFIIALHVFANSLKVLNMKIKTIFRRIHSNKINEIINEIDKINIKYLEILHLLIKVTYLYRINILAVLAYHTFTVIRKIYPIIYSAFYIFNRNESVKRTQYFTILELIINTLVLVDIFLLIIRVISQILKHYSDTKLILRSISTSYNDLHLMKSVSDYEYLFIRLTSH